MSTATASKPAAKPKASSKPKTRKPSGFTLAAEKVLREADGPMHQKDILDAILSRKLATTKSTTPMSTLGPALIWGVRGGLFVQTDRATFDVKELNPRGAKKRPGARSGK